MAMMRAVIIVL
uniref:Uncharacterized protein n=1 Tax=Arundo donax TaxID=35708 RepID=A0A0A8ZIE0_ARUDO